MVRRAVWALFASVWIGGCSDSSSPPQDGEDPERSAGRYMGSMLWEGNWQGIISPRDSLGNLQTGLEASLRFGAASTFHLTVIGDAGRFAKGSYRRFQESSLLWKVDESADERLGRPGVLYDLTYKADASQLNLVGPLGDIKMVRASRGDDSDRDSANDEPSPKDGGDEQIAWLCTDNDGFDWEVTIQADHEFWAEITPQQRRAGAPRSLVLQGRWTDLDPVSGIILMLTGWSNHDSLVGTRLRLEGVQKDRARMGILERSDADTSLPRSRFGCERVAE